jgi:membrane protease YdiL (CAAX protease family)
VETEEMKSTDIVASPDGASPDGASPDGASPDGASPDGASPKPVGNSFRETEWNWIAISLAIAGIFVIRSPTTFGFGYESSSSASVYWTLFLISLFAPQTYLFIATYMSRRRTEIRGSWFFGGLPSLKTLLTEIAIGIPLAFGVITIVAIIFTVMEQFWPGSNEPPERLAQLFQSAQILPIVLLGCAAVFLAPICEEMFFRGVLYNFCRKRLPFALAVLVPAVFFGFVHTFGIRHSISTAILGVAMTLVYEWRKTLLAPMILHCTFNSLASSAMILFTILAIYSPVLGVGGSNSQDGCIVTLIAEDSGAADSDLKIGDVITKFDEAPIYSFAGLKTQVALRRAGDVVVLTVLRDGESLEIPVELRERPKHRKNSTEVPNAESPGEELKD